MGSSFAEATHHQPARMRTGSLVILCCLIVAVFCGRKKNNKDKEDKKDEDKSDTQCGVKYFLVSGTEYQTRCTDTTKTERSTTYQEQCDYQAEISYQEQCSTETVQDPVQSCTVPLLDICHVLCRQRLALHNNVRLAMQRSASMSGTREGQRRIRRTRRRRR